MSCDVECMYGELFRLCSLARVTDYHCNNSSCIQNLPVDLELVAANRRQAGAPEGFAMPASKGPTRVGKDTSGLVSRQVPSSSSSSGSAPQRFALGAGDQKSAGQAAQETAKRQRESGDEHRKKLDRKHKKQTWNKIAKE